MQSHNTNNNTGGIGMTGIRKTVTAAGAVMARAATNATNTSLSPSTFTHPPLGKQRSFPISLAESISKQAGEGNASLLSSPNNPNHPGSVYTNSANPNSPSHLNPTSINNPDYLKLRARWIRDTLDPQIARDGPDALASNEMLELDDLIRQLQSAKLTTYQIQYSRIHLAILDISGRATRWPGLLIDRCDDLLVQWEERYGWHVKLMGTLLYELGGRLHEVCRPEDVKKEMLLAKWIRNKSWHAVGALKSGDLGFKPGE
jgi:hypothetical protein